MTRKRRVFVGFALGCLVLAVVLSFVNAFTGVWSERNGDLPVYLRAAGRMVRGDEIYRPDDLRPFTYPPFLALAAAPVRLLPDEAHRPFWYCFNAAVLAAFLLLIHRNLKGVLGRRRWLFWLLLGVLGGRHASSVFENQSNDLVIALLVALCADLLARSRDASGGALAGLGAALKATPLLFAPVFLWQRRWAAAAGLGAAVAAATFLPDLTCPRDDGKPWVLAWHDVFLKDIGPGKPAAKVGGAWAETNILNQNLAGTIHRLSTPVVEDGDMQVDASLWNPDRAVLKVVTLLAQLLVVGVLLLATRPRWSRDLAPEERALQRWGEAAAVACGMVLLSPMSSKSHFVILFLPFAFCLAHWLYRRRDPVLLAHLALMLASGTLTTKGIWGRRLGNEILARGPVTLCALTALSATAYLLVYRARHGLSEPARNPGPAPDLG